MLEIPKLRQEVNKEDLKGVDFKNFTKVVSSVYKGVKKSLYDEEGILVESSDSEDEKYKIVKKLKNPPPPTFTPSPRSSVDPGNEMTYGRGLKDLKDVKAEKGRQKSIESNKSTKKSTNLHSLNPSIVEKKSSLSPFNQRGSTFTAGK